MKHFFYITLVLFVCSCSLNSESKYWDKKINNIKIVNKVSKELNGDDFDKIKNQVIEYGKSSSFPNIEE